MSGGDNQTWWESLRHFGLLLGPKQVRDLEEEHALPSLPRYRADQLRREWNRFTAEDQTDRRFAYWVLENICGLGGRGAGKWVRGKDVPGEFRHRLVTGVVERPGAVWAGERGGVLPVFFDKGKRVGIGRGRRAVSSVLQWLRRGRLPVALLTNGRQWRLLFAGLDFDAACEWDVDLWFTEGRPGPQVDALRRILNPELLDLGAPDARSPLHETILVSRRGQSELSSLLGERVREAVEALVRAHGSALSSEDLEASGSDIYRAAVRVVMRMVVVLFAESRDLLPRENPVYHFSYGLGGLFEELQKAAVRGRARLERRFGAWPRVLSLFRLILEGCHHLEIPVPVYGGELFAPGDPDAADPVSRVLSVFENACFADECVPDLTVYRMLELLTRTRIRIRQGRASTTTVVPVDFTGLSSEYIGILYEGLLDHELRTAPVDDPVVFPAVGDEPALPLARLEAMEDKQVRELFEKLKEKGGTAGEEEGEEGAGEEGSREEDPEAEDAVDEPEEILGLKVCDPACGSGSFLVASLRFLTDAVHHALHAHGRLEDDWLRPLPELLGLAPAGTEGNETERLPCRPEDDDFEARTKALLKRHVVERCIYGVDLDPLAVELCRLALWIETMDRDLPFSFLDHKIRPGNSLVGCWFDNFQHFPVMAFKNREGGDKSHNNGVHFEKGARTKAIKDFVKERLTPDLVEYVGGVALFLPDRISEAMGVHEEARKTLAGLHSLPVTETADRARVYREEFRGSPAWEALKAAFDLWCACWFWPGGELASAPVPTDLADRPDRVRAISGRISAEKRFLHRELEFPDVFDGAGAGFDAILGNPPWDIAKPNSKEFFSNIDPLYRSYGKQEALRKQTEYFADCDAEEAWLSYSADFKAQSNFGKYATAPFGDPARADKSQDRFCIAVRCGPADLRACGEEMKVTSGITAPALVDRRLRQVRERA